MTFRTKQSYIKIWVLKKSLICVSIVYYILIQGNIDLFQTVMLTLPKKEHALSCKDNLKLSHRQKNTNDTETVTELE